MLDVILLILFQHPKMRIERILKPREENVQQELFSTAAATKVAAEFQHPKTVLFLILVGGNLHRRSKPRSLTQRKKKR